MRRGILFFLVLSGLVLSNCNKTTSPKELVIGEWAFSVAPDKNVHTNQGVDENRTVFCGGERLKFNEDQTFELNDVKNGTWSFADDEITISLNEAYACGDYPVGTLTFTIEEITSNTLQVGHAYHVFNENKYQLLKQ